MKNEVRAMGFSAVALALAFAVIPSTAQAQIRRLDDDPVTPRMMAMGGRAEILGSTGAIFSNPASVATSRVFHSDAYFLWDPTVNRFTTGSAVVDSTRSIVAGGVSYLYNTVDNQSQSDQRSGHEARLMLAVPIANTFGIGISGRYLNVTNGPQMLPNTTLNRNPWGGFTFDAGLFVKPFNWLSGSVSGRNLNNPDTTAAPIGLGFGLSLNPLSMLNIIGDVLLDFRQTGELRGRYSGGVELFLAERFAIRGGYAFDNIRDAHIVTAGLGYISESFAVELGMRQAVVPEPQTTLIIAARYFYRPQQ